MPSTKTIIVSALMALSLASCSTPKDIIYFQDSYRGKEMSVSPVAEIKVQPHDQLYINVSCSDSRLNEQFNLAAPANASGADNFIGYTVDSNGCIDFPFIGLTKVSGMTRQQIAETIKSRLRTSDLVKDPVVTVSFLNLGVVVLGEVNSPGRVPIIKDKLTLLDALSQAGDLTINGVRTDVKVIREENGKQKVYVVDLTDAMGVYSSPAYYMQQEDVIYVEPNKKAMRAATANGNALQTVNFWMSLLTLLTSVSVMIIKK